MLILFGVILPLTSKIRAYIKFEKSNPRKNLIFELRQVFPTFQMVLRFEKSRIIYNYHEILSLLKTDNQVKLLKLKFFLC